MNSDLFICGNLRLSAVYLLPIGLPNRQEGIHNLGVKMCAGFFLYY